MIKYIIFSILILISVINCQVCNHGLVHSLEYTHLLPFQGFVPYPPDAPERFPYSLEYMYVSMHDIMLDEDEFDFSVIEGFANSAKADNVQFIFRVCVDYPDVSPPEGPFRPSDYLNEDMIDYSGGQYPAYSDDLIEAMVILIGKLAEVYDYDNRIAAIEVGMLGHWGEFHHDGGYTPSGQGFPGKAKQEAILNAYHNSFTNTPVMVSVDQQWQSSAKVMETLSVGFHHDAFLRGTDTERVAIRGLEIQNLTQQWKSQQWGGEISPSVRAGAMLDSNMDKYKADIDLWPSSWLMYDYLWRPGVAVGSEKYNNAIYAIEHMGYKFHVSKVLYHEKGIDVYINNTGPTPIYYDTYPAISINGAPKIQSNSNLKLLRGERIVRFSNNAIGEINQDIEIDLTIECEHKLPTQIIYFANAEAPNGTITLQFVNACKGMTTDVVVRDLYWESSCACVNEEDTVGWKCFDDGSAVDEGDCSELVYPAPGPCKICEEPASGAWWQALLAVIGSLALLVPLGIFLYKKKKNSSRTAKKPLTGKPNIQIVKQEYAPRLAAKPVIPVKPRLTKTPSLKPKPNRQNYNNNSYQQQEEMYDQGWYQDEQGNWIDRDGNYWQGDGQDANATDVNDDQGWYQDEQGNWIDKYGNYWQGE